MIRGKVVKPVDNKNANYTSDALDLRNWDGCFFLVHDEGSFSGTVTILGLLAEINEVGAETTSGTTYKQYGSALTIDRVERVDDVPAKIKINVVRSAGAVSVWAQPFNRN